MAESVRWGGGGAQLPEECFTFLTKIHYKAPMPGESPQWGEHEIDYILVARPDADLTIVRPRYPSRAHATRALDLAPHLLLFPKPKEKRLRVLQMLCCLTSDRLWLCGCAGAEPGGGVRGALDEPGRGERLLRTRRHARRADRLLVRRDREPGAPSKSALSTLDSPRLAD